MKMASNLVSIFGVNGQLLQTFKVINPDAFVYWLWRTHAYLQSRAEGFESCENSFIIGEGCAMLRLILINQFW